MFVIELIYKKPLAELDAAMGVHMKFLKKYVRRRQLPDFRPKNPA